METAVEMGKSVLIPKTWYSSLRSSRFGRLRKTKSGNEDVELTKRDEWVVRYFRLFAPAYS